VPFCHSRAVHEAFGVERGRARPYKRFFFHSRQALGAAALEWQMGTLGLPGPKLNVQESEFCVLGL
jgi:hypothetical protein